MAKLMFIVLILKEAYSAHESSKDKVYTQWKPEISKF